MTARRVVSATALLGAASAASLALGLATPGTVSSATSATADASAMIAGLALVGAWIVCLRLAATAVAVGLSALPGLAGELAHRLALAWSPRFAHNLVKAALGLSAAAGPLFSGAAAFADQPALPQLDRVVVTMSEAPSPVDVGTHPRVPPRPAVRATTQDAGGHVIVVRPGDTLWGIAGHALPPGHTDADVARAWPRWYAANRGVIGADPGQIRPGQHLVAPG